MYRNLNPVALGITGRQSEIIELALTHGFRGLELEIEDFVKRAQRSGLEQASRFLTSAGLRVGGFKLPISWRGDEGLYKSELEKLGEIAKVAASLGAACCCADVLPASDHLPYHENFEMHRQRLGEIAEKLAPHRVGLAIRFFVDPARREGRTFQFICESDALVTLIKSIGVSNVGLLLDTWNWHFGGGTLEHLRALGGERILAVSIAGAPAGTDVASITEKQRTLPAADDAVNNVGILKLLNEQRFRGPVTLLPHPNCFSKMTREAIVTKCSAVLDDLWSAAGIAKVSKLASASAAD